MQQPVWVDTLLQQFRGVFLDRVVAGHEHHAALLQAWDGVGGGTEHTIWTFMRRGVGGHVLCLD